MVINEFNNIVIDGIAGAVSKKWVSIDSLKDGDNDDSLEKFIKTTGIQGRYEAEEKQTAADFCYAAANHLLEEKHVDKEMIGVLVYVTQYPDYKSPATACVLQYRLGLSKNCIAFDVNLGCSGYPYGINIVMSLLSTSDVKYGLLLTGDTCAKGNEQSGNSRLLFGDAGVATLLKIETMETHPCIASMSDGSGFKALWRPYGYSRHPDKADIVGIHDEIGVFNFAINEAPRMINNFLREKDQTPSDYDCLVLHQANLFIMKQIAKRTKFDVNKVLVSLDRFGNTSSASIPLTLIKYYGHETRNEVINILTCGFGVGLSWGLLSMKMNKGDIFSLIETDEYFDDGLYLNLK